jgi:hypothetical protein
VGGPATCTISTAGAVALEACWRARLCTVERSRACWRAGEGRVCRHRLGNGRISGSLARERGRNFSISSPGSGQG